METDLKTMSGETIALTDISQELARLWDEEQGKSKVRACLFTLILFAKKESLSAYYEILVRSVISKFPCRVMCIGREEKGEFLKTSVSTETIVQGELQIFCDIIHVEAAGALAERVPFILLPHILPDLPVYLLWTQDPSQESSVLPFLEPFATRILFDTESTPDLQKYSKTVLDLGSGFHCGVGDLNWSALSGWRSLITSVFSPVEALRHLALCKTMRISYNNISLRKQHNEVQAAYLQGWIATQLGWRFHAFERSEGNFRITYKRPTGLAVVYLTPQDHEKLPSGTLLEVEVESSEDRAHYVFKRHPDTRQVFFQFSDALQCHLPTASYLSGAGEGQEIVEEIFRRKGGEPYVHMLRLLSQIPWSQK